MEIEKNWTLLNLHCLTFVFENAGRILNDGHSMEEQEAFKMEYISEQIFDLYELLEIRYL